MTPEEPSFGDEIIQDKVPEHTAPRRDFFRPWHRVRKEYIRSRQWNLLTERMVERYWKRELQQPEHEFSLDDSQASDLPFEPNANSFLKRPLKCLVIPGEDLLDLRALYRDLERLNCSIRYLGFNESGGSKQSDTQVHISNNAVTSLPRVWKDSMVLHDRFEAIAQSESQATRYLREYGPFHVVNLDLCGSLFPNTAKASGEYYEALGALLRYQCVRQNAEWLLFVTTMVEPSVVHAADFNKLCGPTRRNYDDHRRFAELIASQVPEGAFPASPLTIQFSSLSEEQMVRLFGLAFGKWLLTLCQGAQPKWTVAMRRSFVYSMNERKGAVMLSLAFEFKPNIAPPVDNTGMTAIRPSPNAFPSELECATKILESTANIRDVEAILAADPGLRDQLRDAQATLLEAAGYDRAAYLKWVADGEVSSGT